MWFVKSNNHNNQRKNYNTDNRHNNFYGGMCIGYYIKRMGLIYKSFFFASHIKYVYIIIFAIGICTIQLINTTFFAYYAIFVIVKNNGIVVIIANAEIKYIIFWYVVSLYLKNGDMFKYSIVSGFGCERK